METLGCWFHEKLRERHPLIHNAIDVVHIHVLLSIDRRSSMSTASAAFLLSGELKLREIEGN